MQQTHAAAHAPRPLPLFLELVRMVGETEPLLASEALRGLSTYERAPRRHKRRARPIGYRAGAACLRDCGGAGPPAILIPSLINPPHILDLDEATSLADAVGGMGRRALLVDWGPAARRRHLGLGDHVFELLVPLLRQLDEAPALVGYCLGGTMAIAAANLIEVERVATLAAPWRFGGYPNEARASLQRLWAQAGPAAQELEALPMEVLQAAFWSLDPKRTVDKFAAFGRMEPESDQARRFVTLEDWANEGEALPFPAARELIEDLFERDLSGTGEWQVAGCAITDALDVPLLHLLASDDRIAPPATAAAGPSRSIHAGHVGMVVGSARADLHRELAAFLA